MIVLDTHAWIWWHDDPRRLSDRAQSAIDAASVVSVSAISAWEAALLAVRGRISPDIEMRAWIRRALAHPRSESVPLSPELALDAALLEREGFHGDPADRFIYATARSVGARLVTRDERIRSFDPARTIW